MIMGLIILLPLSLNCLNVSLSNEQSIKVQAENLHFLTVNFRNTQDVNNESYITLPSQRLSSTVTRLRTKLVYEE